MNIRVHFRILAAIVPILIGAYESSIALEVSGTVKDKITGTPIANATVIIMDTEFSTQSDADGNYYFPDVPEGTYDFLVGGDDYQPLMLISTEVRPYLCGDADSNGIVDILDIIFMIDNKFKEGPSPPFEPADVNNDGIYDILDIIMLIDHKFKGQPAPVC